jgi:large subunit ribosomal protein L4
MADKVKKTISKSKPVTKAVKAKVVSAAKAAKKSPTVAKKTAVEHEKTITKAVASTGDITVPTVNSNGESGSPMSFAYSAQIPKTSAVQIAQAVRVYLANQHQGTHSTKTRGEVAGSTRKIYRQKGTGRARHGSIKAPIFVGGGIVFGPRPHSPHLDFPQKMRRQVFTSVLSEKIKTNHFTVISGMGDCTPKTKAMAALLQKLSLNDKKLLVVVNPDQKNLILAGRNLPLVTIIPAAAISLRDILMHEHLLITKEAVSVLQNRLPKVAN